MKYPFKKSITMTLATISLLVGSIFISANVMADEPSASCCNQISQQIQGLKEVISRNFITLFDYMNKLVEGDLDFSDEINHGSAMGTTLSSGTTNALASKASDLSTQLTLVRDPSTYNQVVANMVNLIPKNSKTAATQEQLAAFNIGHLLKVPSFKSKEQLETAANLVQFISASGNLPLLLGDNFQDVDNASVNNYRTALGTFAATQSIATNTLNEMIAQRTPVPGLGSFIGSGGSASPLELQQAVATLPLSSSWTSKMATAAPVDVQRETLFLISHLNYQIYQMNRNIERMNVTNAGLLLQLQNGIDEKKLEALRQRAMQSVQN